MSRTVIQKSVDRKVKQHGSLRAAGRAMQVTAAYLSRLRSGEKCSPSDAVLRKLGVMREVRIVYKWRSP